MRIARCGPATPHYPREDREVVMRYLLGFLCVCALGVMPVVGCSETAGDGGSGGAGGVGGQGGDGPGTLLSAEEIASDEIDPGGRGIRGWRVLYASESIDGTPIEVSGIVIASSEPPADGVRDVISFGNGSVGLFDACTASDHIQSYPWLFYNMVPQLISQGYVYVATDYEGLDTPGVHRYLIGPSEGRGVLDIVRAAQQIEEAYAGDRTVLWGISQGGHAVLFAAEIAREWAPEIEVLGAVAAAPGATEWDSLLDDMAADLPDVRGYLWMATLAYEDAYPELSLEDIYDPQTIATIRDLADQGACWAPFGAAAAGVANAGFVTSPNELPAWRERLLENSPGYTRTETPTLMT